MALQARLTHSVAESCCVLRVRSPGAESRVCQWGTSVHREELPFELATLLSSLGHLRLCDPMNRSTPGLPVHHQLPEFTQTYVH